MLLALHSLLFQESSSIDANVSINGSDVISYDGNSVTTGTSLINALGNDIVSNSNSISKRCLSLPMGPYIDVIDLNLVSEIIKTVIW